MVSVFLAALAVVFLVTFVVLGPLMWEWPAVAVTYKYLHFAAYFAAPPLPTSWCLVFSHAFWATVATAIYCESKRVLAVTVLFAACFVLLGIVWRAHYGHQ